jgi:hypothetical protein
VALKGAVRYVDSDTAISDDEGLEVRLRAEYKAAEELTLAVEAGHIWVGAPMPMPAVSRFSTA